MPPTIETPSSTPRSRGRSDVNPDQHQRIGHIDKRGSDSHPNIKKEHTRKTTRTGKQISKPARSHPPRGEGGVGSVRRARESCAVNPDHRVNSVPRLRSLIYSGACVSPAALRSYGTTFSLRSPARAKASFGRRWGTAGETAQQVFV